MREADCSSAAARNVPQMSTYENLRRTAGELRRHTGGEHAPCGTVRLVGSALAALGRCRTAGGTGPGRGFKSFRPTLPPALAYADGSRGDRPPYDPVTILNVLIAAAQNNISDAWIGLMMTLTSAIASWFSPALIVEWIHP